MERMIFIAGVYPKQKKLEYSAGPKVCTSCGRYGSYDVYMEYNTFSLFFIPIIKWKKRYFVVTTCCQERMELDSQVGERIEKGENIQIREADLTRSRGSEGIKYCSNCGQPIDPGFTYCPNCGSKQK
ncbi:MAG: zinc ribbon domain-containing protein [Bacillota bacterium]